MKPIKYLFILILLGIFFIGMTRLFVLRFESGDVYPPYSSLRADPMGSKILYEVLKSFESLSVSRNYLPASKTPVDKETLLLSLGEYPGGVKYLPRSQFSDVENLARAGADVFIAFKPVTQTSHFWEHNEESGDDEQSETEPATESPGAETADDPESETDDKTKEKEEELRKHYVSMKEHWGLAFKYAEASGRHEGEVPVGPGMADKHRDAGYPDLPQNLAGITLSHFEVNDEAWKILYTVGEHIVMVERVFGEGRIIMSADTYFFSNESLWRDWSTPFLYWLIKGKSKILFDEYHFGLMESEGLMDLVNKYQLLPVLLSAFLVALLFIIRNATSLIPPQKIQGSVHQKNAVASTRGYFAGLTSLLRRHIVSNKILWVCFDEWIRSVTHGHLKVYNLTKAKKEKIHELISCTSVKKVDTVTAYKAIVETINR